MASPLPRECSTTELKGLFHCPKHRVIRPATGNFSSQIGAGEGNRTLVISLEGFSSTIELRPHGSLPQQFTTRKTPKTWWRGLDSNQRTRKRADLQSAAINHSATPPWGTTDYRLSKYACQQQLANIFGKPRKTRRNSQFQYHLYNFNLVCIDQYS